MSPTSKKDEVKQQHLLLKVQRFAGWRLQQHVCQCASIFFRNQASKLNDVAVAMLLIDLIWIYTYMGPRYERMVAAIQGSPMSVDTTYAALAYASMVIGMNELVVPAKDRTRAGAVWGLLIYGTYNGTAGAVFSDWDPKVAAVDVAWGSRFGCVDHPLYELTPKMDFYDLKRKYEETAAWLNTFPEHVKTPASNLLTRTFEPLYATEPTFSSEQLRNLVEAVEDARFEAFMFRADTNDPALWSSVVDRIETVFKDEIPKPSKPECITM